MSKIHYFQRYSSVENTVTNNTLQLLARIYSYSPLKASQFLSDLTGEAIEIGIEINQQVRDRGAIPDGQVIQRSFKVLIESKLDAPPDTDQLLRHSNTFSDENLKILLLLTKKPLEVTKDDNIKHQISQLPSRVIFKSITYEDICNVAKTLFKEHEYEMCALVDDYVEYCNDTDLFDQSRYLMRIVPCGESFEINKKYGIYFRPSDQGYTKHRFVGIYKDKTVKVIWEIDSIFDVIYKDGELKKTCVEGRNDHEFDRKLIEIIGDAKDECGYDIETGHRFFCGQPISTNYVKSSPGGIQGPRFVNLQEVIGKDFDKLDASDIARKLQGEKWE